MKPDPLDYASTRKPRNGLVRSLDIFLLVFWGCVAVLIIIVVAVVFPLDVGQAKRDAEKQADALNHITTMPFTQASTQPATRP